MFILLHNNNIYSSYTVSINTEKLLEAEQKAIEYIQETFFMNASYDMSDVYTKFSEEFELINLKHIELFQ